LGIGDWGLGVWGFGVWGGHPTPKTKTHTPQTKNPKLKII